MNASHKYLFETSFDPEDIRKAAEQRTRAAKQAAEAEAAAKSVAKEPPRPAEPTFSKADLEAARAQGHEAGEQAGQAAAAASAQQRLADTLAEVSRQLAPMIEQQALNQETMVEQSIEIALAITRKVLPELARRKGLTEIEALVRECLQDLSEEPRVVIRVADDLLDLMRARVDPLAASLGFPGSIVLLAERSLGPADCRVEWADGGAERLTDQVWHDIETSVARFLDYPQPIMPAGPVAAPQPPSPEAVASAPLPADGARSEEAGGNAAPSTPTPEPAADPGTDQPDPPQRSAAKPDQGQAKARTTPRDRHDDTAPNSGAGGQ